MARASAEEGILTRTITGEPEPEVVAVEEAPAKTETQETKPEEKPVESAAGLSSLFG